MKKNSLIKKTARIFWKFIERFKSKFVNYVKTTGVKNLVGWTFLIVLIILTGVKLWAGKNAQAAWFNSSWSFRQKIPISNTSGTTQTDFQVQLTGANAINTASLISAGKLQSNCNDMRFTDNKGKLLPFWIEPSTCNTASTIVWIKVPSIPSQTSGTTTDVYFYYGNPTANTAGYTPSQVFIRDATQAALTWPLDDTLSTQSYSRVANTAVATGRNILLDGDGEGDVTKWTAQNSAVVTNQAGSPHSGTNVVRVAGNGVTANPQAVQTQFTPGRTYKVNGFYRSDGASTPSIGFGAPQVTGTTSTSWQSFTLTFVITNGTFQMRSSLATGYAEFDDVTITELNIPASSATATQILVDGNMEALDTSAWSVNQSALLTKQTTNPHSGSRLLRVAYNGTPAAEAYQNILTVGNAYRISGFMRSDGTAIPRVTANGGTAVSTGTSSTSWQPFDAVIVATAAGVTFRNNTSSGYVEFDDITVSVDNYIRSDSILSTLDGNMEIAPTTGTATSGGATTLTDSTQTWTTNQFSGWILTITSGTGLGQSKSVLSNTSTVITVTAWVTNPDNTSVYQLIPYWTVLNLPAISKQTTSPHGGTYNIRVMSTGTVAAAAQQAVLAVGKRYNITGYMRGDGTTGVPSIRDTGNVIATGTTSNSWQPFDATFTATTTSLRLSNAVATANGYVEFDDITLTEVDPVVGLPTNGVLLGQSSGASGHLTNAYSFDGTNDGVHLLTATSTSLNSVLNQSEGTVVAWAKYTGSWTDGTKRMIINLQVDANNNIAISKSSTNNRLDVTYAAGGTVLTASDTSFSPATWFQVAITWSKSNDQVKMYVNGTQIGSTLTGLGTWIGNLDQAGTFIGIANTTNNFPWTGLINDTQLYTKALSSVEISDLYGNGTVDRQAYLTSNYPGQQLIRQYNPLVVVGTAATEEAGINPILWWEFDDPNPAGTGSEVKDSSSNNNNGTLGGTTVPSWQDESQCVSIKCLYFDGITSKVTGTKVANNIMSVSFWIKPTTNSNLGIINFDGGTHKISTSSTGTLTATGFTSPTYYVNGVQQASAPILTMGSWQYVSVTTGTAFNSTASFTIGTDGTNFFNGYIDELKFYNYARTLSQHQVGFNQYANKLGYPAVYAALNNSLIAAWPLDDTLTTQSYSRISNPGVAAGRNMLLNGTFDADISWIKAGAWTISGGVAHYTGDGATLTQSIPMVVGRAYQVTYTISNFVTVSGGMHVLLGNNAGAAGATRTANGTYTDTVVNLTNGSVIVQPTGASTSTFDIDNISVTEVNIPASNSVPNQILNTDVWNNLGTGAWTAVNSATLTAQTTARHDGQTGTVLRVARNLVNNPSARQNSLVIGSVYRVYGWARSDGTAAPTVQQDATTLFTGSNETIWQYFDVSFVATNTNIQLGSNALASTGYVEFDVTVVSLDNFISNSTQIMQDGDQEALSATGTATSGGASSLTDSIQTWTTNVFANQIVTIISGTGVGQSKTISSNTATVLTISGSWTINPDNTSVYQIISYWGFLNAAVVSKQTTSPHGGTYVIRVASTGTISASAQETILNIGKTYRITGYMRGDGTTGIPSIRTGSAVVKDGTTSNVWQAFDVTFISGSTAIRLSNAIATAGGYGEFDDIVLTEVDPMSGLPTNGVSFPTASNGHLSSAYFFDGTNDVVNIYSSELNSTLNPSEGTVVVWAKVSGSGVWTDATLRRIFVASDGTGNNRITVYRSVTNNQLVAEYDAGGTASSVSTTSSSTNWMMITLTWSKSSDQFKFYMNGSQNGSTVNGLGTWVANLNANSAVIGANGSSGIQPWSGLINDVKVFNRALSPSEISQLYGNAPTPVGWWKMDEGTGTSTIDSSGNGNTGTLANGPTWVSGKYGKAVNFDGTNDVITIPDNTNINASTSSFTIAGWFNRNAFGNTDVLINKRSNATTCSSSSATPGYLIQIDATNKFDFCVDDGANIISTSTTNAYSSSGWHHFEVVLDRSTNKTYTYIDGVLQTTSSAQALTTLANTQILTIGAKNSAGSNSIHGTMDDVKIYNYARSPDQILQDMGSQTPPSTYGARVPKPLDWWSFDEGYGTTNAAHNIGINGPGSDNGTITTGTWLTRVSGSCKENGCISLTANGSNVSAGDVAYIDGLSQLTASMWINPQTLGTTRMILSKANTTTQRVFAIQTDSTTQSEIKVFIASSASDTANFCKTSGLGLTASSWQQLSVVYDGTATIGSNIKVYKNSNLITCTVTGTIPTTLVTSTTSNLKLGQGDDTTPNALLAYYDEVKIYDAALTQSQIEEDMNGSLAVSYGGITGATEASLLTDTAGNPPIAYWNFDEKTGTSANDVSGNANTVTLNGNFNFNSDSGWTTGRIGSAIHYDGVDDVAQTASSINFNLVGSGDFTIGTWVKLDTLSNSVNSRIITEKTDASNGYHLAVINSASGTCASRFIFEVDKAGTYSFSGCSTSNAAATTNTWYYLTGVFNGTTNTATLYVNGVPQVAGTAQNLGLGVTNVLTFASQSTAGTNLLDGSIDETRVYNYARTQAQIEYDYNHGKPVGWWQFDECQGTTAFDNSGNGNNGTIIIGSGGTQALAGTCNTASTAWGNGATGKFNSSLNFDGVDDYVTSTTAPTTNVDNWTVSAWVNPQTLNTGFGMVVYNGNDAGGYGFGIGGNNGGIGSKLIGLLGSVTFINTNYTFANTGTWYHVVMTRVSGTTSFYVNGVLQSTTSSSTPITPNARFSIGAQFTGSSPQYQINAKIDEVAVFNYGFSLAQVQKLYNDGFNVFYGPSIGNP